MTMTLLHRLALMALALIVFCSNGQAQEVIVSIEPTMRIPSAVTLEINGVPTDLAPSPPAGFVYRGNVALSGETWESNVLLVVRWPGVNQSLTLRLTRMSQPTLKVWVYNRQYSADKATLDSIDKGRIDLNSLLERYYVARDVYSGITTQTHEVKIRALKLWFDAAFNLSKRYRFIGRDEEVIERTVELETRAKTDPKVAEMLKKVAGSTDYFSLMTQQYKALYLDEISLVERLTRSGFTRGAEIINSHYLNTLSVLPEKELKSLLETQRLSLDVLSKNAAYLSSIASNPAGTVQVAMFPENRI